MRKMRFVIVFLLIATATGAPHDGSQGDQTKGTQTSTDTAAPPAGEGGYQSNTQGSQPTTTAKENSHAEHDKGEKDKVEPANDQKAEEVKDYKWEEHDLKYTVFSPICTGNIKFIKNLAFENDQYKVVEELDEHVVECSIGVDIFSDRDVFLARFVHQSLIMACGEFCKVHEGGRTKKIGTKVLMQEKDPGFDPIVTTDEQKQKIQKFDEGIKAKVKLTVAKLLPVRMAQLKLRSNKLSVEKAALILQAEEAAKQRLEKQRKALELAKTKASQAASGAAKNPEDGDNTVVAEQKEDGSGQHHEEKTTAGEAR